MNIIKAYETKTNEPKNKGKRIINEVIFKFFTRYGWGKVHNKMGLKDFNDGFHGVEMTLLLCVQPGWWYPGNTCENSPRTPEFHEYPPLVGNCSEPTCDVVEFFH